MAVSDTDLLLVQRGTVPYKTTADALASYSNSKIEVGDGKDVPIASSSQLGVIKVGTNLDIQADGTLNAVIPAGLTYKGTWTDADNPPTPADNGDFYIWDGGDGVTLNNALWGSENGQTVNEGDRLFYDGTSWAIVEGGGGGGLTEITGTAPVVVSAVADGEQDVSMPAATASNDGYMPKEAWAKLDGIEAGGEVNVDPTQSYAAAPTNGTLTLTPGGDTTTIPLCDGTNAGLMSPTDKTTLDNLVSSPGGVLSLVAGDGIAVNTAAAPGSAGTPEVNVKFAGTGADDTTLVMPANLQLLGDLP
jgi:hypothetical protein